MDYCSSSIWRSNAGIQFDGELGSWEVGHVPQNVPQSGTPFKNVVQSIKCLKWVVGELGSWAVGYVPWSGILVPQNVPQSGTPFKYGTSSWPAHAFV